MNKDKQVSIVIPVYNEAERIHDCLQAIADQTVQPLEVIVVDNNSDDGTPGIARAFPFVRVLTESQQGVVYARDTGFNAAQGAIIARIDADTVIAPDWVATLQQIFDEEDVDMVTGMMTYREITAAWLVNKLDLLWRRRMARLLDTEVAMQGANMALRRTVWQAIATHVCHERGLHEDFDLGIHAHWQGFHLRFDERLAASVCYRQADYDFRSFSEYTLISPRTYLDHGLKSGRHMYEVVAFVLLLYPIISVLSRGYDENLGRFSWLTLLLGSTLARPNPATFVD